MDCLAPVFMVDNSIEWSASVMLTWDEFGFSSSFGRGGNCNRCLYVCLRFRLYHEINAETKNANKFIID